MASKSERAIASGLLSRSKSTTRGGSGNGYNRMSAEDTRDESFGEEQARSIDANNATYALDGSPARIETSLLDCDLLSPESGSHLFTTFPRLRKTKNRSFPGEPNQNSHDQKRHTSLFHGRDFLCQVANFTIRPGLRPGSAARASCRTPTIDCRSSQNPPVRP